MKKILILILSVVLLSTCAQKKPNSFDKYYGTPIISVAPYYPTQALKKGIQGDVIINFIVTTNGSVSNPVVLSSTGDGIFDNEALRAIQKFKYMPKVVDGKAVEYKLSNTIKFRLSSK